MRVLHNYLVQRNHLLNVSTISSSNLFQRLRPIYLQFTVIYFEIFWRFLDFIFFNQMIRLIGLMYLFDRYLRRRGIY